MMLKIPVNRNMSILAGGGWQRMYDAGPEDRNGRSSLLFTAGVELF